MLVVKQVGKQGGEKGKDMRASRALLPQALPKVMVLEPIVREGSLGEKGGKRGEREEVSGLGLAEVGRGCGVKKRCIVIGVVDDCDDFEFWMKREMVSKSCQ